MAFLLRRVYSSAAMLKDPYGHARVTVTNPCPVHQGAVLESSQLQQLAQKSRGHWKEMTKEEVVQLYRASFPATFKEISASRGDYKKVVPYVLFGTAVGVVMAIFLSRTVGPTRPPTFNNPEWEAATREKQIRTRSNPIEGISSKQKA